jgi:hypothetical protein
MIYGFVCQDLRLQIRQSRNVTDGHQGGQSGHVEEAGVVEAGVNESNRSGPYKITYHRLCARVKSTHLVKRANTPPTSNIPLNLMLTRKSIHHEVRLIFYHQTRFLFVSPQALNHFLNMVSLEARAVIHHVEVKHVMYNNHPDREKSSFSWLQTCIRFATSSQPFGL